MEILFKASIAITIALLFYKLVLQQESFFGTNRLYLSGCILLAFALHFISIPKLISQQGYLSTIFEENTSERIPETFSSEEILPVNPSEKPEAAVQFSPEVSSEGSFEEPLAYPDTPEAISASPESIAEEQVTAGEFDPVYWLSMLYLFGVVVFSFSLLFQLSCVGYEILTAREKIRDGSYIIVNTATPKAPCSFFNFIFIYPDEYDFETYDQILAHEKIHVKMGHSFDLLLAEMAVILLWFNPFIWFLKREIEKNNEYQTDSILLEKEQVRRDRYQLNLLQIAVPNKPLNITTNYNQSLIKQRIMMMNAKKSTPHAYWKYAFLAPLFFGILLLLNEPAIGQEKEKPAATEATASASEAATEINEQQSLRNARKQDREELRQQREAMVTQRQEMQQQREVLVAQRKEQVMQRQQLREQVMEARAQTIEARATTRAAASARTISIGDSRADMTKGVWNSTLENGKYCIQFRGSRDGSSWNMGNCFNRASFRKQADNEFVMTRETGTLTLTGNLDAEAGQGKYTFTENREFRNFLSANDISADDKNLMFHLFFGNVGRNYVEFLLAEYDNLDADKLKALAIHGVSQDRFRNFVNLFEKYSNKKPSINEVLEARIHGIDEAYVEELQKVGYRDLSLREMMQAKIHGVNAAYIATLRDAGLTDLRMEEIVQAKIHGVDASSLKEMLALGARMDIDEIVQLHIHGVDASYVNTLQAAGLSDLSMDEIVQAKIHGVDAQTIKEMQDLGADLDMDEIVRLKIHGVNASYINELRAAGITDLDLDEISSAKIHGLRGETIKEIRAIGVEDLDFEDLLQAQIHRVNGAFVADLQKAGFSNLSMDELVKAKIHGINSNFIERSRKNGYDLDSIDKYIRLKIHGNAMESLKSGKR